MFYHKNKVLKKKSMKIEKENPLLQKQIAFLFFYHYFKKYLLFLQNFHLYISKIIFKILLKNFLSFKILKIIQFKDFILLIDFNSKITIK